MRTRKNFVLSLLVFLSLGIASTYADGVKYAAYVVYGEKLQTPMPRIVANLYNVNGEFVATTITDTDGIFAFENLNAGESYSVHFSTDLAPFGVDLADAYMLLNYLNANADLSELQLMAADVNGDNQVNYSDFSFILSRWFLRGEDFPAGDWVLPVWTFTAPSAFKTTTTEKGPDGPITIVSQSDISADVPPVIKEAKMLNHKIKEILFSENQYEISLPISFVKNQKVFGMGLEMAFNNADIEIVGINSNLKDVDFAIDGNSFKLGWVSNIGESFSANQDFMELSLRLNNFEALESVLGVLSQAQFVGEEGGLLQNVQLNMPKLKKSVQDLSVGNAYPNPGNNEISFELKQSNAETVAVEIYNLAGQLVKQINVSPENSKITISTGELPNGSYLCSINMNAKREVKLFNVQH